MKLLLATIYIIAVSGCQPTAATTSLADISPSAELVALSELTGVPLPAEVQKRCSELDERGIEDGLIRNLHVKSFNDAVEAARRAELAAVNYSRNKDDAMTVAATKDAVSRWQDAARYRGEINCLEISIQRRRY